MGKSKHPLRSKFRVALYALIGGTPEELILMDKRVSNIEAAVTDVAKGRRK